MRKLLQQARSAATSMEKLVAAENWDLMILRILEETSRTLRKKVQEEKAKLRQL
jgi:hypothetical protein